MAPSSTRPSGAPNTDARRHLRSTLDAGRRARVEFPSLRGDESQKENLAQALDALVVDASPLGGCRLVVVNLIGIEVGDRCRITLSDMHMLEAEVAWVRPMEATILQLGLRYLE